MKDVAGKVVRWEVKFTLVYRQMDRRFDKWPKTGYNLTRPLKSKCGIHFSRALPPLSPKTEQ